MSTDVVTVLRINDLQECYLGLRKEIDWVMKDVKEIMYRLNAVTALPSEHEIRLENVERIMNKLEDYIINKSQKDVVTKLPHKCPICLGKKTLPVIKYTDNVHTEFYYACEACEGKGIVWG